MIIKRIKKAVVILTFFAVLTGAMAMPLVAEAATVSKKLTVQKGMYYQKESVGWCKVIISYKTTDGKKLSDVKASLASGTTTIPLSITYGTPTINYNESKSKVTITCPYTLKDNLGKRIGGKTLTVTLNADNTYSVKEVGGTL